MRDPTANEVRGLKRGGEESRGWRAEREGRSGGGVVMNRDCLEKSCKEFVL